MSNKRRIWTMGHFPFLMGGEVNQPITTEVDFIEEKDLGKGIKAFSFKTVKGTLKIAESRTGGIVADSFEQLIEQIKDSTKKELNDQLDRAQLVVDKATKHLSNEEFFKLYRY